MGFKVAEFEIEELNGVDKKEQARQEDVLNEFNDKHLQENIREILERGSKNYYRYVINEVLTKPIYVGEITFSGNSKGEFEIGIGIEKEFQHQGYGYRLLTILIDLMCKVKPVKAFTYRVMSNNEASKCLAEKLGGQLIKNVEPPKPIGFTFLIYKIQPFTVDYTFLTKYISTFKNIDFGEWLNVGKGFFSDVIYGKPVVKFIDDIQLFVDINKHLDLKNYLEILRNNNVKDIFAEIGSMNEQCLYASLVYCMRQERFCEGLLLSALKKGHITKILERLEFIHKN